MARSHDEHDQEAQAEDYPDYPDGIAFKKFNRCLSSSFYSASGKRRKVNGDCRNSAPQKHHPGGTYPPPPNPPPV